MKTCSVVIASLLFLATSCSKPSDQDLAERFNRNEMDFEKLARMSKEDARVVRVARDFTWLDTNAAWPRPEEQLGFSRKRWDEYRQLFDLLKLTFGLSKNEDHPGVIFFPAQMSGATTGGDEKGFAYSERQPSPLVDTLDTISPEVKSLQPIFKKLRKNWYLYYRWDD